MIYRDSIYLRKRNSSLCNIFYETKRQLFSDEVKMHSQIYLRLRVPKFSCMECNVVHVKIRFLPRLRCSYPNTACIMNAFLYQMPALWAYMLRVKEFPLRQGHTASPATTVKAV